MSSRSFILLIWFYYCLRTRWSYALKIQLAYTPDFVKEMGSELQGAQEIIGKVTESLSNIVKVTSSFHFELHDDCDLAKLMKNSSFALEKGTDLLVVVSQPATTGRVVVGADVCQTVGGRPVALRMQVAKSFRFKTTTRAESMNWILHAYLHGLAFNDKLMSKFIQTGEHYKYFVDDEIKAMLQEHSRCPNLEGARIQKKNPTAPRWERVECLSSAIHWEKLAHWDDVMSYPPGPALTRLTTKALNSLGHFRIKNGPLMRWGKNAPCSFLESGCKAMDLTKTKKRQETYPLCDWEDYRDKGSRKYMCDEWNTRLLTCEWKNWPAGTPNVPFLFHNRKETVGGKTISGETLSGNDMILKNCPLWKDAYNEQAKTLQQCSNAQLQPKAKDNKLLEIYGPQSICLEHESAEVVKCSDNVQTRAKIEPMGAGCYEHKCEEGRLKVRAYSPASVGAAGKFMQQWKVCWAKGSKVNFERSLSPGKLHESYRVSIICPSCKSVCEKSPFEKNFTCLKEAPFINSRDVTGKPCSGCTYGRLLSDYLLFYIIFRFIFVYGLCTYA